MSYVLGVDGGNTKTDYLLYDVRGDIAGHLRAGTCSHEAIGMEGARREMGRQIRSLLDGAGAAAGEVVAAAFGLAGVDQPRQQKALTEIVRSLGFENSLVMNDSFLGIKAGSVSGTGICSINGTGTAAGGIDCEGHWMQVGGLGQVISGDEAGGTYLAGCTLRAAYDAIFRFGPPTALRARVTALFGCTQVDDLHEKLSTGYLFGKDVTTLDLIGVLFAASSEGDAVAHGIVCRTADALARSAAGCAVRLRFDGTIPVVLIGSVWAKGRHRPMIDCFGERFARYAGKACALHILEVAPAVGSILWALELAAGEVPSPSLRARVMAGAGGLSGELS